MLTLWKKNTSKAAGGGGGGKKKKLQFQYHPPPPHTAKSGSCGQVLVTQVDTLGPVWT